MLKNRENCRCFLCKTIVLAVCKNCGMFFADNRQSFLSFQKGDLIVLEQTNGDGANFINSSWCYGECLRTGLSGDFPAECVYVLPTITKPPTEILVSVIDSCHRHRRSLQGGRVGGAKPPKRFVTEVIKTAKR